MKFLFSRNLQILMLSTILNYRYQPLRTSESDYDDDVDDNSEDAAHQSLISDYEDNSESDSENSMTSEQEWRITSKPIGNSILYQPSADGNSRYIANTVIRHTTGKDEAQRTPAAKCYPMEWSPFRPSLIPSPFYKLSDRTATANSQSVYPKTPNYDNIIDQQLANAMGKLRMPDSPMLWSPVKSTGI
jgi:hypothetical protein